MSMATLRQRPRQDKKRLLARLEALGWSQAELARRIGRNPTYLSRVLAGLVVSATVWKQAWDAVGAEEQARQKVPA
jgi:AraC-like DNA-binding protein